MMDETWFDELVGRLGRFGTRRDALRAAGVAGAAALLGAAGLDAGAKKKKKKCKAPRVKCGKACCAVGQVCTNGQCSAPPPPDECAIARNGNTWTLQQDCGISKSLLIPSGVTFDGNNKTIALVGPSINYYAEGGVSALGGGSVTMRNFTLVPPNDPFCSSLNLSLIAYQGTSGRIENVTVQRSGPGLRCHNAIDLQGSAGPRVDVDNVDITGAEYAVFNRAIDGSVSNSRIRDSASAMLIGIGADVSITANTLEGNDRGINTGGGANVVVTNNTLVGPGPIDGFTLGINCGTGVTGSVSGNTILNFFDSRGGPDNVACGIQVAADAGEVTIGTNTFPDPPGNEQNICDFSGTLRSRRGHGDDLSIASWRAGSRYLGIEETDRDTSGLERGGKHGRAHSRRKRARR